MRILALLLCLLLPGLATAQGVATLIADQVEVTGDQRLIASGNIEAFYDGTRLSAARIIYDRSADRMTIEGPIFIQTPEGTILTADRAELDPRLENGLLRGARLVLDQQLQLAANRIDRVDGRYAQLAQVAASSCQICATRAPLWDIRAARVIHDADEQQLYFTDATLRVRGVPVFWVPQMRLPDPTLTRATGFLIPRFRTTDQLSTGIKLPYFIRLGDHRDITLTPYLSAETSTLEAVYRQAFLSGDISVNAAATDDTLTEDLRSYLFAQGRFDLGRDYTLDFELQSVSDPAYLLDYGFADQDRLESQIRLTRVRDLDLFQAQISYFESLRDDDVDGALPPVTARLSYTRRIPQPGGAFLDLGLSADTVIRTVTGDNDLARDLTRIGGSAAWRQDWVMTNGVLVDLSAGVTAGYFDVSDDTDFGDLRPQVIPAAQVTLRWPLLRRGADGVSYMLEPTVAIAWSDQFGDTAPNEDSTRAELDQANLFALSRYPGDDQTELGLRAAAGLTWSRQTRDGANATFSFGRIVRQDPATDFSASSGLSGRTSDWLIAGQILTANGLRVEARTLYDDDLEITRGAARLNWGTPDVSVAAAYIWQAADPAESRPDAVSEWVLDSTVKLSEAWTVSFDGRYDVAADSPARAGIGIEWRNECVTVDLSVSRRFTSSTTIDPSTDYGFGITLNGFSAGRSATGPAAQCTQ